MKYLQFCRGLTIACCCLCWSTSKIALAVDYESFEFNDANGTQLGSVTNTANPGNSWFVDPDMGGSQTQQNLGGRPGSYYIIKSSSSSDNNFLQIADITSGTRYLTAKISGWSFFETSNEQFRLGFLNGDTEPNFSNLITAQMSLVRLSTGEVELTGGALGTGSSPIASNVTFAAERTSPFEMTLALDKTANTYKVFYRDGAGPTQVLGSGQVDPTRAGKAIRMQSAGIFGDFAQFFPSEVLDYFAVDRIALTDVNPHSDLITLEIDRDNGAMTLRNTSGAAINGIQSYSITSAAGGLNPANWTPIAGGTNVSSNEELMQTFAGGTNLSNGQVISLSTVAGAWLKSPFEDVSMVLNLTGGATRTVNVNFIDNGGTRFSFGDLNFDNSITTADYVLLKNNAEGNLTGLSRAEGYRLGDLSGNGVNSIEDFIQFKAIYEAANGGAGSFDAMLAAIPEPSTLLLTAFAAVMSFSMRRRSRIANMRFSSRAQNHSAFRASLGAIAMPLGRHLLTFTVLVFASAMTCASVKAAIFEDFTFSEPNGTVLGDVENSANPGNNWLIHGNTVDSSVFNGSYRINKQSVVGQAANALEIANITSGKSYLVVDIAGWSYTSTASSTSERVRFAFMDNDPASIGGSTVTAEMNIDRLGSALTLRGEALGTGSTALLGTQYSLPLVQTSPVKLVLELDKDTDKYSVFYQDGVNPVGTLGTGDLGASTLNSGDRDGNSIRFAFTGAFGDTGEFFDVSRIYLTDTNPLSGPITPVALTLEVRSNGQVFIRNATTNPISFDSYRIASGSASLNEAGWSSLESGGFDSVGPGAGQHWTAAGGSSDSVLAESFLLAESTLDPDEQFPLGSAFKVGGTHDLTFQYRDTVTSALVSVVPTYVTVAGVAGDYNNDGTVNAADYTIWRDKLGQSFQLQNEGGISPGVVDAADYTFWKSRFGAISGSGSASLSAVPEPAGLAILAGLAVCGLAVGRRRECA